MTLNLNGSININLKDKSTVIQMIIVMVIIRKEYDNVHSNEKNEIMTVVIKIIVIMHSSSKKSKSLKQSNMTL